MRLTSYTDFGLRALLYLATLPEGELSSVAKVSALYDVSRNHMVKVVNQLVKLAICSHNAARMVASAWRAPPKRSISGK